MRVRVITTPRSVVVVLTQRRRGVYIDGLVDGADLQGQIDAGARSGEELEDRANQAIKAGGLGFEAVMTGGE